MAPASPALARDVLGGNSLVVTRGSQAILELAGEDTGLSPAFYQSAPHFPVPCRSAAIAVDLADRVRCDNM